MVRIGAVLHVAPGDLQSASGEAASDERIVAEALVRQTAAGMTDAIASSDLRRHPNAATRRADPALFPNA